MQLIKYLFFILSATINVVVIGGILFLFSGGATRFFHDGFAAPMFERATTQFEIVPKQTGGIVFLGDSITEGGEWSELFPNRLVKNRGISSDTAEISKTRLPEIIASKPDKVFVLLGTNDLYLNAPPNEVAVHILEIVRTIKTGAPDTEIYVQSLLPRARRYKSRVEQTNQLIQAAINDEAFWIDLYPHFLDERGESIRDDLSNDELHLLGSGYILWRDLISEHVVDEDEL